MSDHFQRLITRAQSGEDRAMAELWKQFQPAVLRYVASAVPSSAIDDVASEAWISAARGLRAFSGDQPQFASWLFTIVRRRVIDFHRAQKRHVDPPTTTYGRTHPTDVSDDALDAVVGERAIAHIRSVLSPDQAEVILLCVLAGLSTESVARITGKRAGAVRILQHRGLKKLARELAHSANPTESDGGV